MLKILDNIEKSYSEKFFYTFYNLNNNNQMVPVRLNRQQVYERRYLQVRLAEKLSGAKVVLEQKIEYLSNKKNLIKSRYELLVDKFRLCRQSYLEGKPEETVNEIEVPERKILYGNKILVTPLKALKKRLSVLETNIDSLMERKDIESIRKYNLDN